MINQATQNVLKVFLASPGDLVEERKVVGSAVDSINRSIRKIGWHIELFVWEDTLPGYGRPQEIINPDVDKCDLFIGLLWKRWGQPTGGGYESGFEEEFERAITRRRKTNSPQIWIIFKKLTPEDKIDLGEQRKKVLEFRQKLEESNELKYQEFEDISDFKDKIKDWLREYVDNIALPNLLALQGPRAESQLVPQVTENPPPIAPTGEESKQPALLQLSDLMKRFTQKINTGKLDFLPNEKIDKFSIVRLFLFASAFMSKNYYIELFGVHEINILYKNRKLLELADEEMYQLYRTVINDKNVVVPGWFWFKAFNLIAHEDFLFYCAIYDRNNAVRKRAFEILSSARIKLTSPAFDDIARCCWRDTSEEVRKAGWNYLGIIGKSLDDFAELGKYLDDEKSDVREEASRARLMILARIDPNRALSEIISTQQTSIEYLIEEIKKQSKEISDYLLLEALSHHDKTVRFFALNELFRRDKISEEQELAMLKDPSIEIRDFCFKELIKRGKKFNTEEIREALKDRSSTSWFGSLLSVDVDPDEVILMMYHQIPPEELFALIDWYSIDGQIAYKALAIYHFDKISDNIRINLSTNFEVLKQESRKKAVIKYGEEAAESLFKYDEKLDNFIRAQFTAAALAGIAVNGKPEDIQICRRFLKDSDRSVKLEAIKIINRFGDASDAEILLEIAKESYGDLKELAANTALKLSPNIDGAASILLQSNDATLVGFSIKSLLGEEIEKVSQILEPLLSSENKNIREKVISYFYIKLDKEKLEKMLEKNLEKPSYYYNVVCWLDRILYTPSPLKEMYKQQLEAQL